MRLNYCTLPTSTTNEKRPENVGSSNDERPFTAVCTPFAASLTEPDG